MAGVNKSDHYWGNLFKGNISRLKADASVEEVYQTIFFHSKINPIQVLGETNIDDVKSIYWAKFWYHIPFCSWSKLKFYGILVQFYGNLTWVKGKDRQELLWIQKKEKP